YNGDISFTAVWQSAGIMTITPLIDWVIGKDRLNNATLLFEDWVGLNNGHREIAYSTCRIFILALC
ncbi:MAG: hypothetical protein ACXW01_06385, partial [Methylobacter sp.]